MKLDNVSGKRKFLSSMCSNHDLEGGNSISLRKLAIKVCKWHYMTNKSNRWRTSVRLVWAGKEGIIITTSRKCQAFCVIEFENVTKFSGFDQDSWKSEICMILKEHDWWFNFRMWFTITLKEWMDMQVRDWTRCIGKQRWWFTCFGPPSE